MNFPMKRLVLLIGCCLVPALRAVGPHPTILTVQYKDKMLPVAKVIGTDPVVMVDGKEKRIRTEPVFEPRRASDYSTETVQILKMKLGGTQMAVVANVADAGERPAQYGDVGGMAEFEATLKAPRTLEGAFVTVVLYFPAQIVVHDLPTLPAGKEVPVHITSKMFTYRPGQQYFVQIFDRTGHEIFTPASTSSWGYYAWTERARLARALVGYRVKYAFQDHPATPAITIKPLLPDGTAPTTWGLSARLFVSAEGAVENVALIGSAGSAVDQAVREALGGWLFLPQMKAGEPVPCVLEVPIQF
jgi:hypothetical protein